MNKEQQELLDEAYENYLNNFIKPICPPNLDVQPDYYKPMTKEWFIKSTQENNSRGQEFSEKWGLKIKERELSLEERFNIRYPGGKFSVFQENYPNTHKRNNPNDLLDAFDIPTKLITITYNDKTIESYES
jgi:hypothetical protein